MYIVHLGCKYLVYISFPVLQMHRVYATSRGAGLDLGDRAEVIVRKGAKIHELVDAALAWGQPHTAYIFGGLPDMVKKEEDTRSGYQEFVMREPVDTCVQRVVAIYERASQLLKEAEIVPVFATVVPMDIGKWNCMRLRQGRTSRLVYQGEYIQQQARHEAACIEVAHRIRHLNAQANVITPYMASVVMKHRNRRYTFHYDVLVDGVHGKQQAQQQWSSLLCKAIERNLTVHSMRIAKRSRDCMDDDDDEAGEDKRGWRNERFRQEGAGAWGVRRIVM